jgi:hypothetical protein
MVTLVAKVAFHLKVREKVVTVFRLVLEFAAELLMHRAFGQVSDVTDHARDRETAAREGLAVVVSFLPVRV